MTSQAFNRRWRASAFSLIEVVIATAVFATSIVAIIGLMSPLSKRVEDIIDSETAGRLAESIQTELARIGYESAVTLTQNGSMVLVANPRGDRVRLAGAPGDPIDNALDHATVPGIAERDRYFLITLTRFPAFDPAVSGSLPLQAAVVWPYQLPVGPATPGNTVASGAGADDFESTQPTARQALSYFFALNP